MKPQYRRTKSRLIDDFSVRPGTGSISGHPQAAQFPSVGMTLSTYQRQRTGKMPRATVAALPRSKPGRWARFRSHVTKKRMLRIFVALLILFVAWFGFKFFYNISKTFGGNIFGLFHTTRLRGEDVGRVNILLAGNSADDPGHDGANLTDSIMIVSLDTKNHSAYMISIPRDLWVDIPNFGHAKINAAYEDGENEHFSAAGFPNGGMGLLEEVVQQDFGIPINYYALVDYSALRDAVNAVGGIDVTIHSSDPRGLYDPSIDWTTNGPLVNLSNGPHHLDGEQALDLARARGDASGSYGFPQADFDRTEHQREMLTALKDKITSSSVLANPLKLTALFDTMGKNVRTDFTVSEAHRLYDLGKQINGGSLKSIGLNNVNGKNLLTSYQAPGGASALIPAAGLDNYTDIQNFLRELTSSNPVVRENASVVVLNATNMYGIAKKNGDMLSGQGIDVTAEADATDTQPTTTIIDVTGDKMPNTLAFLKTKFGASVTTNNPYVSQYPDADFIVLVGADHA